MMIFKGLKLVAGAALMMSVVAGAALAQTPTNAQKSALRSNCSSDFRAHCSGVSPGGMDALMCLEQNEASLSPGCKSAVDAIKGPSTTPAPTKSEAAPAAPTTTQAAAPAAAPAASAAAAPAAAPASTSVLAAPMPLREEVRLVARSCFGDFNRLCPNLPMGQGNMVRCLKGHAGQLSGTCKSAMGQAGAL